jgi:hypothetical protein
MQNKQPGLSIFPVGVFLLFVDATIFDTVVPV